MDHYLTKLIDFHFAMRLYSDNAQMTSKHGTVYCCAFLTISGCQLPLSYFNLIIIFYVINL